MPRLLAGSPAAGSGGKRRRPSACGLRLAAAAGKIGWSGPDGRSGCGNVP